MKTVIEMAKEVGFMVIHEGDAETGPWYECFTEEIERFAELVRADERKSMMQLFTDPENQPTQHGTVTFEYMQREIADEREQIAQIIEDAPALVEFVQNEYGGCSVCGFTPKVAAAAIRARSKDEK